jgi:hypothetical protein
MFHQAYPGEPGFLVEENFYLNSANFKHSAKINQDRIKQP